LRLAAGDWALEAAPTRGGAVLTLTRAGRDILRPTPDDAASPTDYACFPLVPYANRIADGTFAWGDRTITLPRNHPDHAHPLHGIGWLRAWQVTHADARELVMRLDHEGDEHWPWTFAAEQRLALSPAGLTVTLALHNRAAEAMPFSLGLHPYFMRGERLTFAAGVLWLADAEMLPTRHAPADTLGDWSRGGVLERADLIDHCYTGWNGQATIARADGDVVLSAEGASALHLYLPPEQDFFCAEPVSAMPDAFNHDQGALLAPGARAQITMTIGNA